MAASSSSNHHHHLHSSYGDRTSEFRSLSETLKKIHGITNAHNNNSSSAPLPPPSASSPQSQQEGTGGSSSSSLVQFHNKASTIGSGLRDISQKISRLSILAKRSTIFDDPMLEIQELTALIKNDISLLNSQLSELQFLQSSEVADGISSNETLVHATAIHDDLKSRLMGATKQFKDVLTTRTENLRAHDKRKRFFSTNLTREDLFHNRQQRASELPSWASNKQSSDGVLIANQLRRRPTTDNMPASLSEASMMQELVPHHENHIQSHATALQNIETTISELGGIFTNLATMVSQQGDLAIRIDDNMDKSLANVENARSALAKHLSRISSNRRLLMKIFIILVIFILVFILFVV